MKKYILPLDTCTIDFINGKYNKIINNNDIKILASECKTFAALNDELRNNSKYYIPSNRNIYGYENRYDMIDDVEDQYDKHWLKHILTEEYNDIIKVLTYNDLKLKMSLKKPITTPMKEKTFEVWNVDKQEVEKDRKKKITSKPKRKPVKKCRCKK